MCRSCCSSWAAPSPRASRSSAARSSTGSAERSGPIGWRAAGALDGEVAFLAGAVTKAMLFTGGVDSVIGHDPALADVAREAYIEGAARAARQLRSAAPAADEIVLSGRMTSEPAVHDALLAALAGLGEVRMLDGLRLARQAGRPGGGARGGWPGRWHASGPGESAQDSGGDGNGAGPPARHHTRGRPPPARSARWLSGGRTCSSPACRPGRSRFPPPARATVSRRSTRSATWIFARWPRCSRSAPTVPRAIRRRPRWPRAGR